MRLVYGSYFHVENEARVDSITTSREFNKRNQVIDATVRWQISGKLYGATQALVTYEMQLLELAYSRQEDLILLDNSGNVAQALRNAGSITGVRVVSGPTWGSGDPAEYTTYRSYSITLEAVYPGILDGSLLTDFSETVTVTGNGGPRFVVVELQEGLPERQQVRGRTLVRASQTGRAVGKYGFPIIPQPIWPQWLDEPDTQVSETSPMPTGLTGYENYAVQWSYSFTSPVPLNGTPNLWR